MHIDLQHTLRTIERPTGDASLLKRAIEDDMMGLNRFSPRCHGFCELRSDIVASAIYFARVRALVEQYRGTSCNRKRVRTGGRGPV